MDGRSWCRGMLRQEAITTLSIISSDAKVPKGAVSISRTVTGESALMRRECKRTCVECMIFICVCMCVA